MKCSRILLSALALIMVFSMVAAGAQYRDGMYVGISDATNKGYVMAIVGVSGGAVKSVVLNEMTGTTDRKGADYRWESWHEAMKVLPTRFIAANSSQVDVFTGATGTSTKAMKAVERALDKALVSRPAGGKYFDGTFLGASPADSRSYGIALVTVKNDKIVEVELNEVLLPDKNLKDFETYAHQVTVEGRLTMQKRFVEAGNAKVDSITGSTGSSKKFIQAVEAALKLAEK